MLLLQITWKEIVSLILAGYSKNYKIKDSGLLLSDMVIISYAADFETKSEFLFLMFVLLTQRIFSENP
jgi:hypothetical protein